MRLIDADKIQEKFSEILKGDFVDDYGQGFQSAIIAVLGLPTIEPQPNDPLAMEELLEMDGEPVWCVDGRGNECWCLVNCDDGVPCCYDNETGLWEDCFYNMTGSGKFGLHESGWLAYRRRPEEAADGT